MKPLIFLFWIALVSLVSCTNDKVVETDPVKLFSCSTLDEPTRFGTAIYQNVLDFEKDLIADEYLSKDGKGYMKIFEKMALTGRPVVLGDYAIEGIDDRSPSILRCLISHYIITHRETFEDGGKKLLKLAVQTQKEMTFENAGSILAKHILEAFNEEDFQQDGYKIIFLLHFYFSSDMVALPRLPAFPEGN